MIKASANGPNGKVIVFGLSHENLDRLKNGQPIRFELSEVGLGDGVAFIFSGETETSMAADLSDLIGPQTSVKGVKQ